MARTPKSINPKKNSYNWLHNIFPREEKKQINLKQINLYDAHHIALQPLHKKILNNPNVCHLIKGSSFLLINGACQRLIMLDNHLNTIKHWKLNYDFDIYSTMKSRNECKFLLYDFDNCMLIYLDILKNKIHFYDIPYIENQLSPLYLWKEHDILLTTRSGIFYIVDLINNHINILDKANLQTQDIEFYKFWQYCMPYYSGIRQIDSDKKIFIYESEEADQIILFNYCQDTTMVIKKPRVNYAGNPYHDIMYYNGLFALVSEEEILIINKTTQYQLLPAHRTYKFLRACFTEDNNQLYLNVLSSNQSSSNALTMYKITAV